MAAVTVYGDFDFPILFCFGSWLGGMPLHSSVSWKVQFELGTPFFISLDIDHNGPQIDNFGTISNPH